MPATATPVAQARAILRKNVILKMRLPQNTIFEIGMPLLYAAFLFLFSSIAQSIDEPAGYPMQSQYVYWSPCGMSYAPNTTRETQVMQATAQLLVNDSWTPPPGCLTGYASYEDMRDALVRDNNALRDQTSAAVLLDIPAGTAVDWKYTIMTSTWLGGFGFSESDLKAYGRDYNSSGVASEWVNSGVIKLQWALDRALAEEHTTGAAATMLSAGGSELRAANLPLQSYKSSFKPGSSYLLYIIPFYITFGIAYIGPYMLQAIVLERERKLLEGMKMMGLGVHANAAGWFATFACMHAAAPVVTTLIVKATGFLSNSNLFYVWVTLMLHLCAVSALTFALAPLCQRAKAAPAVFWPAILLGVGLYMAQVRRHPELHPP